ncbi:MAG: asparagine synthetase B [Candidatus Poribacteria bacterium]|nr:asparagine synthetase B [Candidatus Poribacteria bacterium]
MFTHFYSSLHIVKRVLCVSLGIFILLFIGVNSAAAQWLLIPMDLGAQTNHLKAYGLTYWALEVPREYRCYWWLNYRGGAFVLPDSPDVRRHAARMGVRFEPMDNATYSNIKESILQGSNMDEILLEKAPKIAVYAPSEASPYRDPWDDAVKIALDYAQIPYDEIWDKEVQSGVLETGSYDWLHLHHEDFTGQHGKFHASFSTQVWYQQRMLMFEQAAAEAGFRRVASHKGETAQTIADYIANGGFVFAMCSAPETLDIALATLGGAIDIVAPELDGTPIAPDAETHLDFQRTLAFENFKLYTNPFRYEFSDIDNPNPDRDAQSGVEDFKLFEFSAKHDPIPTMLTQNHVSVIPGYLGQTTSFNMDRIRGSVTILGEVEGSNYAKYIHGKLGKGTFTFLGGHDPEDYRHLVGEGKIPTNLDLHKHSPGYRLILNNILFPAARKKPQKT